MLQKQDIYNSLNFIEKNRITNIVILENEIIIDVIINNPTLQAKRKVENEIINSIKKLNDKINVKVNIKTEITKKVNKVKTIPNIKNIITVASGKGGVGKSTITTNLAISLVKLGYKVGVLDADVYGPSQHIMFNVENKKPLSVKIDGRIKMQPIENYGVKLLSLGFFTQPNQAVIWRGPMANKALKQLIFDSEWGELDFLLIDLPPGTGDVHLSIVQSLPINGAVIISTPQNIALADAKKGIAMFKQQTINVPVLGIIENMSYFTSEELPNKKHYIFGKEGAKKLSEELKTEFLGEIPLIQNIRESSDNGVPITLQNNSQSSEIFTEITKKIILQLNKRNKNLPPTEIVKITNMNGCK